MTDAIDNSRIVSPPDIEKIRHDVGSVLAIARSVASQLTGPKPNPDLANQFLQTAMHRLSDVIEYLDGLENSK